MDKSQTWFQWSSRQRMSPFPNYLSMESISNEMEETLGASFNTVVIVYQNNLQTLFVEESDRARMAEHTFNVVRKNPRFFKDRSAEMKERGTSFVDTLKSLKPEDLKKASDTELAHWFDYYQQNYKQIYSRYFPILCIEEPLSNELKSLIAKRNITPDEQAALFTTLTTEPGAYVNLHEELDRLDLVEQILAQEPWKAAFMKSPKACEQALKSDPMLGAVLKMVLDHQHKHYWVTRDYEDPIMTVPDVIARICTVVQSDEEQVRLRGKRDNLEHHDEQVQEAERQLQLTDAEKVLFQLMRDGMYNKEQRKTIVSQSLYHFDKVLEEVSTRTGLPLKLIRFMKMDEVLPTLQGTDMKSLLEQRYELSIWIERHAQPTEVHVGVEAEKWEKVLFSSDENVSELKGMPISKGTVTGPARLMMNPEDGDKVKAGDIIVTIQAVPSFSPAISRAAGIIADGGTGLTSHTATLAREAKIPGITSLKIATKVIKDGDLIEVNGDTGVVKVLKKA